MTETRDGARARSRRAVTALCAAAALTTAGVLLFIWVGHVRSYFFLFDDYALIGQAGPATFRDIFSTPLFNFFRPLAFLVAKGEALAFGWSRPGAYVVCSLALHVAATLVFWRM